MSYPLALFALAPGDTIWSRIKATPRDLQNEPFKARQILEDHQRQWMAIEPSWLFKIDEDKPSSFEYHPWTKESNHGTANDQVRPRSDDEDSRERKWV